MELHYKSKGGQYQVKFDGNSSRELFEAIARFQAVFETHNVCGLCQSTNVLYNVRKAGKSKFYEKKCQESKCGAALMFHSNEDGENLYTTYSDKWAKWVPGQDDDQDETPKKGKK